MKVIFLDHDGVICLYNQWGGRVKKRHKYNKYKKNHGVFNIREYPVEVRFDNFDGKAIAILNDIIKVTDCEIVVSSDWRLNATLEEMGEYYEMKGIIKKPIAYTSIHKLSGSTFHLEEERAWEIKKYLDEHPEVSNWVAIDDLNLAYYSTYNKEVDIRPWGLKNFVLTNADVGLKEKGVKDYVINYLNNKNFIINTIIYE